MTDSRCIEFFNWLKLRADNSKLYQWHLFECHSGINKHYPSRFPHNLTTEFQMSQHNPKCISSPGLVLIRQIFAPLLRGMLFDGRKEEKRACACLHLRRPYWSCGKVVGPQTRSLGSGRSAQSDAGSSWRSEWERYLTGKPWSPPEHLL